MALINQDIRNFILGISQQPPTLRSPEQLEEQLNGFSSEASGLLKRPPTISIKSLGALGELNKPLVHFINRDRLEKYVLIMTGSGIFVFDLQGNRYSVSYENSGSEQYITVEYPRENLRCVTIADYTFIVNRKIIIRENESKLTSNVWDNQGLLVNVKSGQYGRTYRIEINGNTIASYTTPDGSQQSHITNINTDYIRTQLANGARTNGYTVTEGSSWLYITGVSINSYAVYDGYNNQALFATYKTAQKFTNLPASAPDGFTCKVSGDDGSTTDDYYVKYVASEGVWRECAKPGITAGLDKNTMPHALIRQSDGTFLLKAIDWDEREAGDDDSNPMPSFVDNKINNIFYFKNRLGVLSGENVILTASAEFFRWFMASAMNVQDTDPIDLAVSDNTISTLYHSTPFDEELILFSENAQFALQADGVLTPKSAYLTPPVTHYGCTVTAPPTSAGRNVYFVSERSEYTTVREFYTAQDNTDAKDAQDITAHVPSYIPNGVHSIIASNTENVILFLTEGKPTSVFVYKYLFINGQRQQASWSEWNFGVEILGCSFIDGRLYFLTKRNGNLNIEYMVFTYNTLDFDSEPYRIMLDNKKEYTIPNGTYDELTNETVIHMNNVFGEAYEAGKTYGVVCEGEYSESSEEAFVIKGNREGKTVIFGLPYSFRLVVSPLFVRAQSQQGNVEALLEGRLQLRRFWFNYADSGFFTVYVDIKGKNRYAYGNTGYNIGTDRAVFGQRKLATGKFEVPIQAENQKATIILESVMPEPVAIIGAGWIGNYNRKTRKY